jgi:hypothetical protein
VNEVDAIGEIIAVLSGSEPFGGSHPLYGSVQFVPNFPLGDMDVPTVAFSPIGGTNEGRGLGTYKRIGHPLYQVDVLANTELEARRIFQRVRQALQADYENNDGTGMIGKGYLRAKGIRSVVMGEPRSVDWDEAGRVRRVVAEMRIEYLEEEA